MWALARLKKLDATRCVGIHSQIDIPRHEGVGGAWRPSVCSLQRLFFDGPYVSGDDLLVPWFEARPMVVMKDMPHRLVSLGAFSPAMV